MQISTTAVRVIASPPPSTFDLAVDNLRLPEFFPGFGPISAVVRVEQVDEKTVRLHNGDGSVLLQIEEELARPTLHRYRLAEIQPPFAWLVREARSRWSFEPSGTGTRVTWTYTFELRSVFTATVAAVFVKVFMHGAMTRCLARLDALLAPPPR